MRISPRVPFVISLFSGIGLVIAAVILAQLMRLAACPLCIVQRMLDLAIAATALLGLVTLRIRFLNGLSALLMTGFAATGVFVAGYQTYLQRFAKETQCSGAMAWWEALVDWAGEKLPLLFQASGLCSEPGWKFIGLSIAEWSLVAFCFLTLVGLFALLRRR